MNYPIVHVIWHFVPHEGATVALLFNNPDCDIETILDPAVMGYYETGIYRRCPNEAIRFVFYIRAHVDDPTRRYSEAILPPGWRSREDMIWYAVEDVALIAMLDRVLSEQCPMFPAYATDAEWASVAGPETARPVVWRVTSHELLFPSSEFTGDEVLRLLIARRPEVTQEIVDSVIRANHEETLRCYPGCTVKVAEYRLGRSRLREKRFKEVLLPSSWTSLSELQWSQVEDPATLLDLDRLLLLNRDFREAANETEESDLRWDHHHYR